MNHDEHLAFKKLEFFKHQNIKNPIKLWWKKLSDHVVFKLNNPVLDADCCTTSPYNFACVSANKCYLYDGASATISKEYSSHNEYLSVSLRPGGNLIACGTTLGQIDIYDEQYSKRHALRSFKAHNMGVYMVRFSINNTELITGCDEGILKLWDVGSSKLISSTQQHSQRIKCGSTVLNNSSLFVTGSYDHYINIIDWRCSDQVSMRISLDVPIENISLHPNGLFLLSCGATVVDIWDLNKNISRVHHICDHAKTVTSLNFSHSGSFFHSSSLDRNIKSYSMKTLQLVESFKFTDPAIKVCMSQDDHHVWASLINNSENCGIVYVKSQKIEMPISTLLNEEHKDYSIVKRYFYEPSSIESIPKIAKRPFTKFAPYDTYLRKFEYSRCFNYIFCRKNNLDTNIIINVIKELMRRSSLLVAMKEANVNTIIDMLKFIKRNINKQTYSVFLIKLSNFFLDNRHHLDAFSNSITEKDNVKKYLFALKDLSRKITFESDFMKNVYEVVGSLDLVENLTE